MASRAFLNSPGLAYSVLVERLRRMRGSQSALALLEKEADSGACSQRFAQALARAFERTQWGTDENLIVRAAALALTNPQTNGLPSVSNVVSAVVSGLMEEGALRRQRMMREVIARHVSKAAVSAPPRKRQRDI